MNRPLSERDLWLLNEGHKEGQRASMAWSQGREHNNLHEWIAQAEVANNAPSPDRAEIERLQAALAWRAGNEGATHSPDCHKWHYACAMQQMQQIDRLRGLLREAVAYTSSECDRCASIDDIDGMVDASDLTDRIRAALKENDSG